jgi:serine acetyltransferase
MTSARPRSRNYWRRLRQAYAQLETDRRLRERFPTASFGENVFVVSPHLLDLGDHVTIQRGTTLHCGGLEWSEGSGCIEIGPTSFVGPNCVLWGAGEIHLGGGFECGPGTMIFSSAQDFGARVPELVAPPLRFGRVTAGRFVTVYSGAIISPGVTLGDGAVVAAGSVVVTDVPSRQFWGGVPACLIRELPPWTARTQPPTP